MGRCRLLAIALGAVMALGASARAEVVESSPMGFAVRNEAVVKAAPAAAYAALTEAIGRWWDPAPAFSHDARNLSLEPKPGGCLCERLPEGGGVEHMRVVYASPGKLLRLTGAIGPLQEAALAGSMTWALSPAGDGTKIELSYAVGGFRVGGFRDLPTVVDGVLRGQLLRLKAYIETGRPDAPR
jgi:uncharacterized protein YndB with AHSA1/START domain